MASLSAFPVCSSGMESSVSSDGRREAISRTPPSVVAWVQPAQVTSPTTINAKISPNLFISRLLMQRDGGDGARDLFSAPDLDRPRRVERGGDVAALSRP